MVLFNTFQTTEVIPNAGKNENDKVARDKKLIILTLNNYCVVKTLAKLLSHIFSFGCFLCYSVNNRAFPHRFDSFN